MKNKIKKEKNNCQKIEKKKEIIVLEKKLLKIKKIYKKKKKHWTKELILTSKRMQSKYKKKIKYCLKKIVLSCLPSFDSIEKSYENICQFNKNKKIKNLEKILSVFKEIFIIFRKTFEKFKIIPIIEKDIDFDPSIHQAMFLDSSYKKKSNQVVMVMQKGYLLHDRLLRAALVSVSA